MTSHQPEHTLSTASSPTTDVENHINPEFPPKPGDVSKEHRRVLAGAMVGTTIEWFDFFIYAQAAGLIFAQHYFNPATNDRPGLAQIVAWASLGVSFLFRPLGAILAGHLGDRLGRKPVLVLTLLGMGGATVLIGLLPTYETIGIAAPLILVLLRIMQGLSAGGEWGGAALLSVEHAPVNKRGLFGAFPQIGVPSGMFLATIFMLVIAATLTPEQFEAWGWRIPFLSSLVLIAIGFWIRRLVGESPVFEELEALARTESAPLSILIRDHRKPVFLAALIFAGNNAAGYMLIAYFMSYATKVLGHERPTVLAISLAASVLWGISTLGFGALSDKIGRKRTFVWGYIAAIIWAVPTWWLIDTGSIMWYAVALFVLASMLGASYGPQSAMYAEMFPAKVRLSGVSIGYAFGSIIGGAFAPMIAALLLETTGKSTSIGIYIAAVCAVSLIGSLMVPKGIQERSLH